MRHYHKATLILRKYIFIFIMRLIWQKDNNSRWRFVITYLDLLLEGSEADPMTLTHLTPFA